MIVSHAHQFIFLKTRKTAGTSIGASLVRFLGPDDLALGYTGPSLRSGYRPPRFSSCWRWFRPSDIRHPFVYSYRRMMHRVHGLEDQHMEAAAVRQVVGEDVWNSYYKFSFDRHPYDRMISLYCWCTRSSDQPPGFARFVDALHAGDEDFLRSHNLHGHKISNLPIYAIDGQVCVDRVGRFESLNADLEQIAAHLGLPWDGWLPREKGAARPKDATRAAWITPDVAAKLNSIFAAEFALLSYSPDC